MFFLNNVNVTLGEEDKPCDIEVVAYYNIINYHYNIKFGSVYNLISVIVCHTFNNVTDIILDDNLCLKIKLPFVKWRVNSVML